MTARPITVDMDAIVDAEFLDDDGDPDTSVTDPETSENIRAALPTTDAERVAQWTRSKIAADIRALGCAMNPEVLAALVESGTL